MWLVWCGKTNEREKMRGKEDKGIERGREWDTWEASREEDL